MRMNNITFTVSYIVVVFMIYVSSKKHLPKKLLVCENKATKYTCMLHLKKLKNSQLYQLHQIYDSKPFISIRLSVSAINTKLILELESFDNNTFLNVTKSDNKTDIPSNKIILTAKDVVKNKTVRTLNYSESTDIQFSCEKYRSPPKIKKVFTVLINTKMNKIKTLREAKPIDKHRIKIEDTGNILCCVYYSYEWTANGEDLQITRVVVNKTLLIHQPKESLSPEAKNSSDTKGQAMSSTQSNNYIWVVYVLIPIFGVSILILALRVYPISKQACLTNSQPVEETMELDNITHQVLYAELDLVKNTNRQTRNQNEEPKYATVIGQLRSH